MNSTPPRMLRNAASRALPATRLTTPAGKQGTEGIWEIVSSASLDKKQEASMNEYLARQQHVTSAFQSYVRSATLLCTHRPGQPPLSLPPQQGARAHRHARPRPRPPPPAPPPTNARPHQGTPSSSCSSSATLASVHLWGASTVLSVNMDTMGEYTLARCRGGRVLVVVVVVVVIRDRG